MTENTIIWTGRPSQMLNLGVFISCFFLVTIPFALWQFLKIYSIKYELTENRLITYKGVFKRNSDEIELYRVKDYQIVKPFFLRIFDLANLILITSDKSTPTFLLKAINNVEILKNLVRTRVEILRKEKGVREIN